MRDVFSAIHRGCYGESDDPTDDAHNDNPEWLAGHLFGSHCQCDGGLVAITEEWERRGCPSKPTKAFSDWKKGFWAAWTRRVSQRLPNP
jgi:hypothetical protein